MESSAGDPYRRPARRTQWLLSALAHHYGLDRGVENEIVVLATGLDQYLQEVFHHLDCRGTGRLPRADFRALCAVLGLNADGEAAKEDENSTEVAAKNPATGMIAGGDADVREEALLALRADPPELTFRQFHARLCGYFSSRAGPRLPRGALSEHIETQIRLRRPRRRRRPGSPSLHGGAYGERVAHLEEENSSLRELVEDLRAALQSSDARCLALQVRGTPGVETKAPGRGPPPPQLALSTHPLHSNFHPMYHPLRPQLPIRVPSNPRRSLFRQPRSDGSAGIILQEGLRKTERITLPSQRNP